MSAPEQPMLPGFDLPQPGENKIGQSARLQLQKLADDGVLTEDHAIIAQVVLSLADSVGASLAGGKLTIAGVQGTKLLVEALQQLPEGEGSGMAQLMGELRAVS